VLVLVGTNGNKVSLIKQDIGRHQNGISKQTCVYVIGILCRLILELGHSRKLSELGKAVERPHKLCVMRVLALNEYDAALGVDTAGEQHSVAFKGVSAQRCRLLTDGGSVQIGYHEKAVILFLYLGPVFNGTQIVTDGDKSRGLNSRKDYRLFFGGLDLFAHVKAPFIR